VHTCRPLIKNYRISVSYDVCIIKKPFHIKKFLTQILLSLDVDLIRTTDIMNLP